MPLQKGFVAAEVVEDQLNKHVFVCHVHHGLIQKFPHI